MMGLGEPDLLRLQSGIPEDILFKVPLRTLR
jgi:hypothetical protein